MPWILAGGALVLVAAVVALWARNYKKVGPNQVLVISGRSSTVSDAAGVKRRVGYRLQVGGGTLVWPMLESAEVFPLEVFSVGLRCPDVLTAQGILISAEAQGQVKARGDEPALHRAVENFLSKGSSGITYVAQEVLEGHMRGILGTMAVEEIYAQREQFAQRVREAAGRDFDLLGLELISFSLKDISDAGGYIEALGARRLAEVKRDAAIARAETERDSTINTAVARKEGDVARLKAEAELALATRDFEVNRAQFQAMVNVHRAQADAAYDLEKSKLSLELRTQEYQVRLAEKELATQVEEKEVARREMELEATVKRPAEAMLYQRRLEAESDAYKKELEAKGRAAGVRLEGAAKAEVTQAQGAAEADAMRQKAEAYKEYTDAALAEQVVKVLPELARAISEPLSKVEKIIMVGDNQGAQKITGQVAGVLAQLPTVVESLTGINLQSLIQGLKKEKE